MSLDQSAHSKFLEYHSHPKAISNKDLESLELLIQEFPYCQSIKMLALKSAENTNRFHSLLQEAAASNASRSILYDFIHQPALFFADSEEADQPKNEPDNILFESNNAFGIDLDDLVGSDWNEEELKKQPERKVENEIEKQPEHEGGEEGKDVFGISLSEILGSEFQKEKSVEKPKDLEIRIENSETVEQLTNEQELGANNEEIESLKNQSEETLEDTTSISGEIKPNHDEEVNEEKFIEKKDGENQDQETVKQIINEEENSAGSLVIGNDEINNELESAKVETDDNDQNKNISSETKDANKGFDLEASPKDEIELEFKEANDKIVAEEEVKDSPIAENEKMIESIVESSNEPSETIPDKEIEVPILENVESEDITEDEVIKEEQTKLDTAIQEPKEKSAIRTSEQLAFETPVHSDFLTFVDKEDLKNVEGQKEEVSAYNDDSMPYTFLWWLNKTRKEYAESHQPYVKSKSPSIKLDVQQEIKKQEKDDLNHQIAENIFHLRGVEELTEKSSRTPTVPFEFMRKDFQIIEKFIKEEPQIRPLAPNKIDTENKAKKSSEDSNEVVSETLAKIYIEQMLYHKALDVYKKLSLKFPEKSAYFASQIKYLELKVN